MPCGTERRMSSGISPAENLYVICQKSLNSNDWPLLFRDFYFEKNYDNSLIFVSAGVLTVIFIDSLQI